MKSIPYKPLPLVFAVAMVSTPVSSVFAQQSEPALELEEVIVYGWRENRVSSGATKLPLAIKETPQTISIIESTAMEDFGLTGANDAMILGTGINVEQYETNRASYNARGFEIQLTQVDGLGVSNSYGTVVGQLDTFMFEKIELIRGANGLLTGVGNASGTINYVRKRPTNTNEGKAVISAGSHDFVRAAVDYNTVFTDDGMWAGRFVATHEDKDSYIRDLHDTRTSLYGVLDGQIGKNGLITVGLNYTNNDQDSPMWGSLTLFYPDGSMADFDNSSSTSQNWTYWDKDTTSAFVEYVHVLAGDWEIKGTYSLSRTETETQLFYAYTANDHLEFDNTGLYSWPYTGRTTIDDDLFDINISGSFGAFGQNHTLILGASSYKQETAGKTREYDRAKFQNVALPAFPYRGDVLPEPDWREWQASRSGEQKLTRMYGASHLRVIDDVSVILGVNAIKLEREGSAIYGSAVDQTDYPVTEEVSPYVGVTYDVTDDVLMYASYSDIFQNQDNLDINGRYLAPVKGVNMEVGAKAELFDQRILATLALFTAEQQGVATYGGVSDLGTNYYVPADIDSEGVELEFAGELSDNGYLAFGVTHLELTGHDGKDMFKWVPRTTLSLRYDTSFDAMPDLRVGLIGRWQSKTVGKVARQDAYLHADAFASYQLNDAALVRLNVFNLFNEDYVGGLAHGAIYGAPLSAKVSFEYDF